VKKDLLQSTASIINVYVRFQINLLVLNFKLLCSKIVLNINGPKKYECAENHHYYSWENDFEH